MLFPFLLLSRMDVVFGAFLPCQRLSVGEISIEKFRWMQKTTIVNISVQAVYYSFVRKQKLVTRVSVQAVYYSFVRKQKLVTRAVLLT
ncbi:hypothetical protein VNO78_18680 [Psophocarpus tetragonolobus]|uniref:Secreted protein n=1 Tax=Psophocarpus tetragonolobus TaxID=3891 RepID=A0AAN9SJR8_PSOTE